MVLFFYFQEYLRQFGLEQYDFENYQPDDDPGKYFQDVPLEQNPEALFGEFKKNNGCNTIRY